ncbi:hypothetical protein ABWK42_24710, partial [Bacillus sp. JJ927]|uniref:hypothetical protein n=1 Tax=Bacillus sp. JJ927 TaxID=3122976 RepID=UPI0033991AD9
PHAHQAKILRHPHNENFTFSQLFMRIRLIFSVLGKNQFLKLMAMWMVPQISQNDEKNDKTVR